MVMHYSKSFLLPLAVVAVATAAPAQFAFAAPITTPNPLGFGVNYGSYMRAADLNGDAYPDLLLSGASGTAVALNNMPTSLGFTITTITSVGSGQVYAADLNGDGYDDLVLATYSPTAIQYAINDGTGAFPGPIGSFAIAGTSIRSLVVANLDGDADLEIIVHKKVGAPVEMDILDVTQGVPLPTLSLVTTMPSDSSGSGYQTITTQDVDGDDDLDLVMQTGGILYNQLDQAPASTSPSFLAGSGLGQIWRCSTLATGDINGDGFQDLLAVRPYVGSGSGGVQAWVSGAACGITATDDSLIFADYYGFYGEAADFDNDGRDEVLYSLYLGSTFNLYTTVPTRNGLLVEPVTGIPPELLGGAQVAATADFDMDGYVDIAAWQGSDVSLLMNTSAALADTGKNSEVVTENLWTPATVAPNYIWVDASSSSSSATGTFDQPYATIPEAITAATPGTAIMVRPGQYGADTPGEPIMLDNLQLIGVSGPLVTTLDRYTFHCCNGARLSGFTLRTCPAQSFTSLISVFDATVTGNQLFGAALMNGIVVQPGSHTSNIGSNIVHEFHRGILVEDGSAGAGYASARIYNNTVVDNTYGIEFGVANAIEIVNNLIVDNVVYGIHRNCNGTNLTSLLVDYNWVHTNGVVDNYVTTVPIGVGSCNSPITLQAGTHDINTTWDMDWFVAADSDDFHLTGAQATDLGNPTFLWTQWFPTDIDGDPRSVRHLSQPSTYGLAPDLGADEVVAQRLTFTSDASNWYFTTSTCPTCAEFKGFARSPGWFPGLANSILLLSPFNVVTTGIGYGPESVTTVPKITATIGSRFYVQAIVGDPSTNSLTMTNVVVLTTN